jgi:hypothetical protein
MDIVEWTIGPALRPNAGNRSDGFHGRGLVFNQLEFGIAMIACL